MTDAPPASTTTVDLTSLWLAPASKERIAAGFAATITEGLESAASAAVVVVSTRIPRIRMTSVMQRLSETATCPLVVLCHAGGEMTARDLLMLGATHVVAEGNEAMLAGLLDAGPGTEIVGEDGVVVQMPAPDAEPLLTGFTFDIEHHGSANARDTGIDPVTHLPGDSAFAIRFGELTQRESLPRVGFIRIANTDSSLGELDRPTLDLVRRRLVLQFRNLIAEKSVELFMTQDLELAILSTVLTGPQMARLALELVKVAESFAPSGAEPIHLAIGHAGPEVANDSRTLRELAESATAAAVANGGGVVSGDELALSRANATEHETASALAAWVDDRDQHGGGHGRSVADVAIAIGRELGVDGIDLIRLRLAAKLHDIGKLQLPEDVMSKKPLELSGEELEAYQSHPATGADFVALSVNEDVTKAVRHHHEQWDGSGFPDALNGEDIPFSARVLAVADQLDTIARAVGHDSAAIVAELEQASGAQLDPAVVWAATTLLRTGDLDAVLFT
jgi:HD-GYP domain-containing protein (c-di-GMP phosphodiesterase class II)